MAVNVEMLNVSLEKCVNFACVAHTRENDAIIVGECVWFSTPGKRSGALLRRAVQLGDDAHCI